MMSDRDALYAAILAEPAADAPRLVFADWLEEFSKVSTDHARAQFIRLEIEAESLPLHSEARAKIESQAAKLFTRYRDTWNSEIPGWGKWYRSELIYRRGFPDELSADFARFAFGEDELLKLLPLQVIALTTERDIVWPIDRYDTLLLNFQHIHTFRFAARLTSLTRYTGQSQCETVIVQLLTNPTLRQLSRIDLNRCGLDDAWLMQFAKRLITFDIHRTLTTLDLSDNIITESGLVYLSTAREFSQIRTVLLQGYTIAPDVLRALVNRFGDGLLL